MSRFVVAGCSLWCKTGAFGRFSFSRIPLNQYIACRYYQSKKSSRKLHRRVINERALQEQLDLMKLSVADLESADSFGSLSVDCDIDEELKDLVEVDQAQSTRARKRRKSASSEVSKKTGEHSHKRETFDVRQEKEIKGASQSRQPVAKHSREHKISVPLKVPNETQEHMEIYNKFPDKKSLPDLHPDHKDWSEKFGSLSADVDKFVDKYVADGKRYSCHLLSNPIYSLT